MKRVRAFAPASSGNVIAGFDTLGAALAPVDGEAWGDVVEVREAGSRSLVVEGVDAGSLPLDEPNLVWRALDAWQAERREALPPLAIRLVKGLPVGSGLGSSSASIVGVLRAANALLGASSDDAVLLEAAARAEAGTAGGRHLDNVAPALLGGLRLVAADGKAHALPWFEELRFVVASPALRLETRAARAVLPSALGLGDVVAHARGLATFVHALHAGDRDALRTALADHVAEAPRLPLIPGAADALAAARASGAWGASLSGAGPALLALAAAPEADAVGAAMRDTWRAAGIAATTRVCVLDRRGARVLEEGA